jgi:hypothetical protein
VVHVARNTSAAPITYFEFHIVRRLDVVAPFPNVSFPRASAPARLDPTAKIVHLHDFANGSSGFAEGKSCAFTVHVMPSGSTLDIPDTGDEHFWYSLGGGAVVERNGVRQVFDDNAVIVIPPSSGSIRVVANTKLTLLDFAVHPVKP